MVSKTSRLRAKPEVITLKGADGEEIIYNIKPLKTKEILRMIELAQDKKEMEAFTYMIYETLKKDDPEVTKEEVEELDANFLMEIMKAAERVNGMDGMFSAESQIVKKKEGEGRNPLAGLDKESFRAKVKDIQQRSRG